MLVFHLAALLGVLGGLTLGCGQRASEWPWSARPPSTAAATPPVVPDDPNSCLAPSTQALKQHNTEIISQLQSKVDSALSTLVACQAGLARPEVLELSLEVTAQGTVTTSMNASSPEVCGIANCVKEQLAKLSLPTGSTEPFPRLYLNLHFEPNQPPRVSPRDSTANSAFASVASCGGVHGNTEGRVPPAVVRRLVRNNYQVFRACYEQGLARNPKLQGRVTVRFIIDRDGKVVSPTLWHNEMPDCRVAECIRAGYSSILFPKPEGGIVTVQYPIHLQPG